MRCPVIGGHADSETVRFELPKLGGNCYYHLDEMFLVIDCVLQDKNAAKLLVCNAFYLINIIFCRCKHIKIIVFLQDTDEVCPVNNIGMSMWSDAK